MRYYIEPAQTGAKNSLTIQLINLRVNKRDIIYKFTFGNTNQRIANSEREYSSVCRVSKRTDSDYINSVT